LQAERNRVVIMVNVESPPINNLMSLS
jgi:hypothetical protein